MIEESINLNWNLMDVVARGFHLKSTQFDQTVSNAHPGVLNKLEPALNRRRHTVAKPFPRNGLQVETRVNYLWMEQQSPCVCIAEGWQYMPSGYRGEPVPCRRGSRCCDKNGLHGYPLIQ